MSSTVRVTPVPTYLSYLGNTRRAVNSILSKSVLRARAIPLSMCLKDRLLLCLKVSPFGG
jgi:hypothetical protein